MKLAAGPNKSYIILNIRTNIFEGGVQVVTLCSHRPIGRSDDSADRSLLFAQVSAHLLI